MNKYRPLLIVAWSAAALFLFSVLTILFIPAQVIRGVIARGLEQQGYTMQTKHFGKAFPLGVKAESLEISDVRGSLVKLDRASAVISLPSLCLGKVVIRYHGEIGPGEIDGDISLRPNGKFSLNLDGVQLADIPFFRTVADARVTGNLNARASFQGKKGDLRGELRLWVKEAALNGVKIGGTPLPDAAYETIQGMFRVGGGKGTLESFTLQGRGLYVRLKGDMPITDPLGSAPLNVTLELMPKPEFMESQKFIFLLLTKYLTTPGHYQVPIRGTLARPVIQ